jgi:transcriptional regulator GlxA family with amidase domain
VGLVAVPEAAPAVLYSFFEVLGAAGTAWQTLTGETASARRIAPRVLAERAEPFRTRIGVTITPDAAFAESGQLDAVVVPDLALDVDQPLSGRWPAAVEWIRHQHANGAVISSVCTGSLLLAEAGLLEGLEATTHWSACPLFAAHYPQVRLQPERILVPTGQEHRVVTGGGYGAWAELALYLVARFSGHREAVRIAKIFVLGDRSDGQLPFASMIRPHRHGDAPIERAQAWVALHYDAPRPVARMMTESGLSPRTFKRRFRAATGYSALEYVQTLRIEEAKHLLETTTEATDEVAAQVGYQDPASFRRVFRQLTGVTPARYRRRFAGIALTGATDTPRPAQRPGDG